MGKKRNTAKTGDKALYNSRSKLQHTSASNQDDDDNDMMYNEVDRYHNSKQQLQDDMLKFGEDDSDEEEEGLGNDVENVFDLGLDQDDDDDDDSDDDDSDDGSEEDDSEAGYKARQQDPKPDLDQSGDDSDDSGDSSIFEQEMDEEKLLNWGKHKKDYYHGDTNDLEIGQEVEDAELEEEGAKEVLKARLEGMTEDDFMLDDDDDDDSDEDESETKDQELQQDANTKIERMTGGMTPSSKRRKLSKLSKKEKSKLMKQAHPELIPLVSHFRDEIIRPCKDKTSVVVNALLQNDENAAEVRDVYAKCFS